MSRLTKRGPSKSNLYSAVDADNFVARSKGAHTVRWKASAYRWHGPDGNEELLLDSIPLLGGRLMMDSSDPLRRKLSLEVGGADGLEPRKSIDPLVPFGQFVRLWCTIDRADGTFFPWLKMGEFSIQSYVFERPSLVATVDAVDYSGVVNEFIHENKHHYGNRKVSEAVNGMVRAALPKAYSLEAHTSAQQRNVPHWHSDAGSSRWDEAVKLAEAFGFDTFFDWNGDLVIRPNLGDAQDDIIPESGPDVGTKANPIMTISDGEGGSLVGMTATVTREGACNGVYINIHETADQKAKGKKARAARGDPRVDVQVKALAGTGSPVMYGDVFGRIPLVIEKNVKTITDAIVAEQNTRADHLLQRRRGVVRYIDADMVGGYHLEPDDKVTIKWGNRSEDHYVQSIEWDLTGASATRIRTRQLNVIDPGA